MTKSSTVDSINKVIRNRGSNIFNQPLFRVVFSDDQIEKRRGTYTDLTEQGILLRTVTEVRDTPKYPWCAGRWILERWFPPSMTYHPDIISARNGDYVCIYVFQDKNRNFLPPLFKVVDIIINQVLKDKDWAKEKNKIEEEEAGLEAKETNEIYEAIRTKYENTATQAETGAVGYVKSKIKGTIGYE